MRKWEEARIIVWVPHSILGFSKWCFWLYVNSMIWLHVNPCISLDWLEHMEEEKGVKQVVPLIICQFDLIRLMQKEREI